MANMSAQMLAGGAMGAVVTLLATWLGVRWHAHDELDAEARQEQRNYSANRWQVVDGRLHRLEEQQRRQGEDVAVIKAVVQRLEKR